jgi:hypothetical protein
MHQISGHIYKLKWWMSAAKLSLNASFIRQMLLQTLLFIVIKTLLEQFVPNNTTTTLSIKLNNFLHRIDCKVTMLALVNQHGCSLKRIRRSKNWSLTGEQNQLVELSEQLQQPKTIWIADAIQNALPKPSFDLTAIVLSNPDMTINRLIAETGCTLIEARVAIDKAEALI